MLAHAHKLSLLVPWTLLAVAYMGLLYSYNPFSAWQSLILDSLALASRPDSKS